MKSKWLPLILMFLLVLPVAGFANHEHGKGGGDSLEDMYFGKVYFLFQNKAELGLTEDQLNQIKDIKFDVKRMMIDTEAKKDLAMLDINQELHKDQPDVNKIDSFIDQKHTAKAAFTKNLVRSILNTKAILTPEQQAKAKELYYKK